MNATARLWLLPAVAILCAASPSMGASINDEGWWGAVFTQGDIESDSSTSTCWRWWFDGHSRFHDDADGFNVSIVRPGVGYKLTDTATIWAGYAWIRTSPIGNSSDFDENRIWQQLTWSASPDPIRIGLRSRLEQRFVETGDDTGWRVRQLVTLRRDVPRSDRMTLVAWDEVFIHLNDTDFGARSGFNQNRAFVGFGWKWDPQTPKSRVEIGYLNQYIDSRTGSNRMNHLLSVNFFMQ